VNEKKVKYSKALYLYGFLTLTYLIEEYNQQQNFEECQLILEVLQEHNVKHELDLPTVYDKDSILYFKKCMQDLGYTGNTSLGNIQYYVAEVKKLIDT
jgi:hypothetical protein